MAIIGKNLKKSYESIDREKIYALMDAVSILKKNSFARFDETVEVAISLNIDGAKTDQIIRGIAQLPHGTGKKCRVAVFATGEAAEEAVKAGAEIVGTDDLIQKISSGEINFDKCVASPDLMGLVGKVAKILGPRGLMPNPKTGTVRVDVAAAVMDLKNGQVSFRSEKGGIIHAPVGKISFDEKKIVENIQFLIEIINKEKPTTVKGALIKKMNVSSTVGIGIRFTL